MNELTGLFVLGLGVLAALALFAAARSQHWFAAKASYLLQLPPEGAFGLKPGNDVVLLGLSAGTVREVLVGEDGSLQARISLRQDFARFVRSDSTATIKKVFGVAGDAYVELSSGNGPPLPVQGAVIVCQSSEELPTVMDRLVDELRSETLPVVRKAAGLLEEWTRLGTELHLTQAELHQALARLNRIAAGLEEGKGSAGRLLADATLVERGERLLERTDQVLSQLQLTLKPIQAGAAPLPEIAEALRQSTARLPSISEAVEAEARDLPGLVLQIHQTTHELQRLLEAMQRHWLLRNYVEPRVQDGRIPPAQVLVPGP